MSDLSSLRVAIVGSGPSGFYAAMELLNNRNYDVSVDMYDRLPTPWGLVRAGVAPDHPKTKHVTELFQWCSAQPGFGYYLNVELGKDISHDELCEHYHAVLYSYGASSSRDLGIPGEDLKGSYAATEFVAWYNGHPDYADRQFDLSGKRAVIVGNGNVALDVARILVKDVEELKQTDIADHAIEALSKSNIEEVVVLGRRGVADAAYTSPELLDLGDLNNIDVIVDPSDIEEAQAFASKKAKNSSTLDEYKSSLKLQIASEFSERESQPANRRIVLKFLRSPVELQGDGKVESMRVVCNKLEQQADGSTKAIAGDEFETIETGLVLRSVGYFGKPIAGIPFDDKKGVMPNNAGRATDASSGDPVYGVYCAGWIKRGPSGVIGTNKHCARETVNTLLADFSADKLAEPVKTKEELDDQLNQRNANAVDYQQWRRLNTRECELGEAANRPRVKITSIAEMLSVAKVS